MHKKIDAWASINTHAPIFSVFENVARTLAVPIFQPSLQPAAPSPPSMAAALAVAAGLTERGILDRPARAQLLTAVDGLLEPLQELETCP